MKSAIELIAFANCDRFTGTVTLLEVAMRVLERDGHRLACAHLDLAVHAFLAQEASRATTHVGGAGQLQ